MNISSALLGLIVVVDDKGGVEIPTSVCHHRENRNGA
jgi:hypothetical protein